MGTSVNALAKWNRVTNISMGTATASKSISPSQAADRQAVAEPIEGPAGAKGAVTGRGDDAEAIVELFDEHGSRALIPTQRDLDVRCAGNPELYRQRNLIERLFNKLKHFASTATR